MGGNFMKLKTDRLYICNLCENDWKEMKCLFIDFMHSKYASYDSPLPVEDAEVQALTRQFVDSNLFFAVYLLDTNQMIGYVSFHKDEEKYDLGYLFHSAFHANGYAYESTKAVIEYFVQEFNATDFKAETAIDNTPSCKLLEKLGFVCTSIQPVSFVVNFSFRSGNFVMSINQATSSL